MLATLLLAAAATTSCATADGPPGPAAPGERRAYVAEVWADNWFSLHVNGAAVGEDPVPISTERSFNATRLAFEATAPLTLAVVAKDFKQDDTGLEYIGTDAQQMGDGGLILQITDTATGAVVAGTGVDWRGLVLHRAPLDKRCERSTTPTADCAHRSAPAPAGWAAPGFDDSRWTAARTYTPAEVGTLGGYDRVAWSRRAALIWSADLEADNTILWRARVAG